MKEELNNQENPQRGPKKEKITVEKITYPISYIITKTDKDIDLDFDLSNAAEDHLFAYTVVIADLMNILEKSTELSLSKEFTNTLKSTIDLLKSSLSAHQLIVEKKLGVHNEKHDILNDIENLMVKKQKHDNIIDEIEKELGTSFIKNYKIQSMTIKPEDVESDEKLEELAEKILKDMPKDIDISNANFALGGNLPEDISKRLEKVLRKKLDGLKQNSIDDIDDINDTEQDIEI